MRISDLQRVLNDFMETHGDLEVVATRYSDFVRVEAEDISIVEAVPVQGTQVTGDWVRRFYPNTNQPDKGKFTALHFAGN